jgi:MFS family permease
LPFVAEELGAPARQVTQLVAVYALAAMVASPALGFLSDRIGRKRIVVGTLLLTAVSFAGMLYATTLLALFVFRGLSGAMSGRSGVLNALVIDCSEPEEHARWIGWLGAMNGIGVALGPVLGALFVQVTIPGFTRLQTAFVGALATALATTIVVFLTVPSRASDKNRLRHAADSPRSSRQRSELRALADLLVLNFALFVGFGPIFSTTAIYVEHSFGWHAAEAGYLIGSMALCVAAARIGIGHRLIQRFSAERVLVGSALWFGAMLIASVLVANPVVFVAGYCSAAAGHTVAALCIAKLIAVRSEPTRRGFAMGWITSTGALGVSASAMVNGYLFERIEPGAPFSAAGATVAAAIVMWKMVQSQWAAAETAGTGEVADEPITRS